MSPYYLKEYLLQIEIRLILSAYLCIFPNVFLLTFQAWTDPVDRLPPLMIYRSSWREIYSLSMNLPPFQKRTLKGKKAGVILSNHNFSLDLIYFLNLYLSILTICQHNSHHMIEVWLVFEYSHIGLVKKSMQKVSVPQFVA